jgi:hypothetical protein
LINANVNQEMAKMLRKLERDFLAANLSAVSALLAARSKEDDPIGFLQFSSRKRELEDDLNTLSAQRDPHAELGVFLGAGPTYEARGIDISLAVGALGALQALINAQYCQLNAAFSTQGDVQDLIRRSSMRLTDFLQAPGGFVLEGADDTVEPIGTPLRAVVDTVAALVAQLAGPDERAFAQTIATLHPSVRTRLEQFFALLDQYRASVRMVTGELDFLLDQHMVALAHARFQQVA